jgi:hypothetical protein
MGGTSRVETIIRWAIATALGGVAGVLGGVALMLPLAALHPTLGAAWMGAAMAGGLALGQWLALRPSSPCASRWIPAGLLGGAAGLSVGFLLAPAQGALQGVLFGVGLGLAQWAVHRRPALWASGWLLVSALGLGLVWAQAGGIAGEGGALRFALWTLGYGVSTGLIVTLPGELALVAEARQASG